MKGKREGLLVLSAAGMELTWLYTWAAFLMTSLFHRPFPLPEVLGTFTLSAFLASFIRGRGFRIIWIIGLHLLGVLLTVFWLIHAVNNYAPPFFSRIWFLSLFTTSKSVMERVLIFFTVFWSILFWTRGALFTKRPLAYQTICSRFDLGVTALFVLFITKLVLFAKGGIRLEDPLSGLMIFPFLLFGLISIGIARNRGEAGKGFISGYQAIGMLLTFSAVVLIIGTGIVSCALPYLTVAAKTAYGLFKETLESLQPMLVSILAFIFHGHRLRTHGGSLPSGTETGNTPPPLESTWWSVLLEKCFGWGLFSLFVLLFILVSAVFLWRLFLWLSSRTSKKDTPRRLSRNHLLWLTRLREFLGLCRTAVLTFLKGRRDTISLYKGLLTWGRHSGLPHLLSETPIEYGHRLRTRFSKAAHEVTVIVEAFSMEIYGERVLTRGQLDAAGTAIRKLRSPRHWPARLSSLLHNEKRTRA